AAAFDPPLAGVILAMPFGVRRTRAAELVLTALATRPEKRGILGAIALLIVTSILFHLLVVMRSAAFVSEQLASSAIGAAFALVLTAHGLALGALALRLHQPRLRTLALAAFVPWLLPLTLLRSDERNRRRGISRAGVLRCLAAGELAGLDHAETAQLLVPSFGGRAGGLGLEKLTTSGDRGLEETLSQWTGRRTALATLGVAPLAGESRADTLVRIARLTAIEGKSRAAELVSWAAAACVVCSVLAATSGVFGAILGFVEAIER
ncbi:hypothetical protein L6R52_43650, partial [Myxococcota bacterium]|nr:hypothetical protein [Myxococcota bacterium]